MEIYEIVILVIVGILNLCGVALYVTRDSSKKTKENQPWVYYLLAVAFIFGGLPYTLMEGPRRIAKWCKK